ncbi:hypothetical protein EDI_281390 [Entamoeba dispar SAW760]|uniref:Uncharacterized protein n=1 Tax=Entamoeba dispar (strain ATCC PRA-260 / SAW760) TaxID=370354 RepID=B0ELI6_ENTDS|nr:uncharacterized protein EDI_281390 [Entamoeba dispar SAW760]EDR24615.1 hypothetical protein EDI_281390 [Entamoeba dispar SAW760]|eukprot:EDR24615.1 hypothetical protein EDI_281390 [Entamoeba dispar SAW760]
MMLLFTLICISTALNCASMVDGTLYTKEEAFECIYETSLDISDAVSIQGDIEDLIGMYAYLDILQSPLKEDQYYYVEAHLEEELKSLNTDTQPIYQFYRKVDDIMRLAKDPNLKFKFSSSKKKNFYFDSFKAILPFKFIIDQSTVKTQIIEQSGYTVPQELIDNNNQEVKLINKQKPLEYLRTLSNKLISLKNANTAFNYMLHYHFQIDLGEIPLTSDELEDIVIEYINGVTVTIPYKLLYKEVKGALKNSIKHSNNSQFKYTSDDNNVKCGIFIEGEKSINVIVINSFYYDVSNKTSTYIQTLNKCFEMIDENDYPIEVILPMNEGGDADIEGSIFKLLSPHADNYIYGSVRVDDNSEKILKLDIAQHMYDPKNCQVRRSVSGNNIIINLKKPLGPFYSKPVVDKFENDITHTRSQVSIMKSNDVLFFTELKNHPRSPHQIVIFTDGYCRGTCSFFIKNLAESGSAIIVGYGGDPENNEFDIGTASSIIMASGYALCGSSTDLTKEGSHMTVSFVELYPTDYSFKSNIPREFIKGRSNERVALYDYSDNDINKFVSEGLRLVNKYLIECDVNSPMVLQNPKCDEKLKGEHIHGGHPCIEGRWYTLSCVPSYCDYGYKFDRTSQTCIEDTCYVPPNDTSSSSLEDSSYIPNESSSSSNTNETSSSELQEPTTDSMVYVVVGSAIGFAGIVIIAAVIGIVAVILMNRKSKPKYTTFE